VISTGSLVDIKVYDVSGELVRALDPVEQPAGAQEQAWDLKNTQAAAVASGVYLCRIHAQNAAGESATAWVKAAVAR
jgi:flagellar hook assembly protein FlgD